MDGLRRSEVAALRWADVTDATDGDGVLTPESDPAYEACAAYLDTGSLRDAYRQRSGNDPATPSHRRDSQSASRHAAIREQRQRLREHLIQPVAFSSRLACRSGERAASSGRAE